MKKMTWKEKNQFANELLENGVITLKKDHEYLNCITRKKCKEVLYHVKYDGEVWDVTFVNNRLCSIFALSCR